MRKNKILSVAIAATLCLPIGVAEAAGSFKNVNQTTHGGTVNAAGNAADKVLDNGVPTGTFDNISDNLALVDVGTDGIVYATEIFGGDGPPALPNTTDNRLAAVLYTVDGEISDQMFIEFTLSPESVQFAEDPKLAISDDGNEYTNLLSKIGGGQNQNFIRFLVAANSNPLSDGDQLMFAYRIKSANDVLGTANDKVELTAKLTNISELPVNPQRMVSIAKSTQAVSAELTTEDTGEVKISVSDGSKKFTGAAGAFVSTTTAQIGYLKITNKTGIKESDGQTDFMVGQGIDGKLNDADDAGTKLEITEGQFAASKTPPGEVFLNAGTKTVADEVVDNAATFKLDDTDFPNLRTGEKIGIQFTVDGSTSINTLENPPSASLILDFKQEYVVDLEVPAVELRQIGKDGTVCFVYVVPDANVPREKINIRITNDSGEDGTLSGTLYNGAGEVIGEAEKVLDDLAAGQTIVYQATHLAEKIAEWEGRAMLEITSTLPSLEVLALLRNQSDRSLLTNLSVGASGVSCNR
jgi:hypothetical protein